MCPFFENHDYIKIFQSWFCLVSAVSSGLVSFYDVDNVVQGSFFGPAEPV